MTNLFYTGVGSRNTPHYFCNLMTKVAKRLDDLGYTLRSGGASGADTAFERGTNRKEIYLPWKGFNGNNSDLYNIPNEAYNIAADIHPRWKDLAIYVRKLHARNVLQVLGLYLDNPSKFLVCWTKDGKEIGGTRTAIVLAREYNIPVINIAKDDVKKIGEIVYG